jgi:integrase
VLTVVAERSARFEAVISCTRAKQIEHQTEADKALLTREAAIRTQIQRGGIRAAAKVIGTARTLWKFAVSRGYAARNIAQDVKKPSAPAAIHDGVIDENIFTPAEVERLIAHTDRAHRCAVRFLFMTGMRLGELGGLRWNDVDWASSRIIVRRQRSAIDGEMTAPKTRAGTRWIDLPAGLITELKGHRLVTQGEYVFPIDERNWRTRVWHPALRRAGLRSIRIHDARHTHASLLIGSGADIVAVSRRLGHANPSITLTTYSHAFARRDTAPLGEQLAAFMRKETVGCDLVAAEPSTAAEIHSDGNIYNKFNELLVAREGIEPPTRGFSVRCSTN